MAGVEVREILADEDAGLELRILAGDSGLGRLVDVPRIQKPGLALAGYAEQLHKGRLLCLGGTEVSYLATLDDERRRAAIGTVLSSEPACLVVTRGLQPGAMMADLCQQASVPLLVTALQSADFIERIKLWLDVHLALTTTVHGVMVDVLEVGILLLGHSGVGKSEAALELVERGHRLVADDVVQVQQRADGTLVASSMRDLGHHMEIRGLGIINIADLFGITAVRDVKRLDLVVELSEWDQSQPYDRLGIEDAHYDLLEVRVPFVRLPVRPGRNLASIIEVAARNQLLREVGHHSARDFLSRLDARRARARAQVSE